MKSNGGWAGGRFFGCRLAVLLPPFHQKQIILALLHFVFFYHLLFVEVYLLLSEWQISSFCSLCHRLLTHFDYLPLIFFFEMFPFPEIEQRKFHSSG